MSSTGTRAGLMRQRAQQRAPDEKRLAEQLIGGPGAIELVAGLEQANFEQLPRVVPFVERVRDVEAFVALQPDELGAQSRRQRLGDLGLADARFAFEKQRPAKLQREVDRHHERAVGDVLLSASTRSS